MPSSDIASQSILNKARKDKFILSFDIPKCLRSVESKSTRYTRHKSYLSTMPDQMQYSVYGIVVPAINVPSTNLAIYGQNLKVSSHARSAYEDVTVNFTVDNQFNNFWHIWSWLNILNDAVHSTYDEQSIGTSDVISQTVGYNPNSQRGPEADSNAPKLLEDYQTDMTLYGLNEYNKEVVQFKYIGAFPVSLGGVAYSYRDSGELESSFTFSFSQLYVELID